MRRRFVGCSGVGEVACAKDVLEVVTAGHAVDGDVTTAGVVGMSFGAHDE
jgi:hypothetical protein